MRIREAIPDDLAEILRIQAASPGSAGWSAGDWADLLATPRTMRAWAALETEPGPLLGFLLVRVVDSAEAEILDLAVDPPQRRQGVGRSLLGAFFAVHPGETFLEVRDSNAPAIGLYRRMGFEEAGVRRAYYHSPVENALVMRRTLKHRK